MEEWKLIPESEGRYSVSSEGRIRRENFSYDRCGNTIEMSCKIIELKNHGKYFSFGFHINKKLRVFLVHRLVAINFIHNPDNLPVVNHLDGNKLNNKASNLEWTSYSGNNNHFRRNMVSDKRKQSKENEFYSMEGEEFRYCAEDNVYASNYGRVWGVVRNKMAFKLLHESNGYLVFTSGNKRKSVHRIVAKLFCENNLGFNIVNHINGVKSDNRAHNLEWVDRSYNSTHSFNLGLNKNVGENNKMSRKKEKQIKEIASMIKSGLSLKQIHQETGFDRAFLLNIKEGRAWRHSTGFDKKQRVSNRISDESIEKAKIMYSELLNAPMVSRETGISEGHLWKILTGVKRSNIRPDLTVKNVLSSFNVSNEEVNKILQMHSDGHTFVYISKVLNRDRGTISNVIKKNNQ